MKIHERLEFWFLIFEIRVYLCPLAIRPILGENALQHCELLLTRRPQTMRWQMLLHHTIQRCWILQLLQILIAFRPVTRMRGFLQPRNRHTLSGKLFFPRWPPSLRLLLLLLLWWLLLLSIIGSRLHPLPATHSLPDCAGGSGRWRFLHLLPASHKHLHTNDISQPRRRGLGDRQEP